MKSKMNKAEKKEFAVQILLHAMKYVRNQEYAPVYGQALRILECLVSDVDRS